MTKSTCSFPDCDKPLNSRGLCSGHLWQQRQGHPLAPLRPTRRPSDDPVAWFLAGFDTSGGPDSCHEWQRSRLRKGYGHSTTGPIRDAAGSNGTHVQRWVLANGPVPDGLMVRHVVCDNPPCGNLAHLALGTAQDNANDMVAKGRQLRGAMNNQAKLTGPQVLGILLRLEGGETQTSIARRYGVTLQAINLIARGKGWKHYSLR